MRKRLRKNNFRFDLKFFRIGLFFIFLLFLFWYFSKLVFESKLFLIKNIKTNVSLEKDITYIIKGKTLLNIDLKEIYLKINKMHPEYKKISITKQFPSTLLIDITLREPFAQLECKNFYLIDKEAVIISDGFWQPFSKLIPIRIEDYKFSPKRGSKVLDNRIWIAFSLIDSINKNNFFEKFPVKFIDITKPSILYFVIGDTKVIVGENNFEKKLRLLRRIIEEELKNNLSLIEYIDLRYENVYIGKKE